MNKHKTELLILSGHHRPLLSIEHIEISCEWIQLSSSAENIGVIFEQHLSLDQHVTSICKSTIYLQLLSIAWIRDCLSTTGTEILLHAFITSRLDSCNSLPYGLPKFLIDRLQNVQNSPQNDLLHGAESTTTFHLPKFS